MDYLKNRVFLLMIFLLELMYSKCESIGDYPRNLIPGTDHHSTGVIIMKNSSALIKWRSIKKHNVDVEVILTTSFNPEITVTKIFPVKSEKYTFNNLIGGKVYSVQVCLLIEHYMRTDCMKGTFKTKPNRPNLIKKTAHSLTELLVEWLPPFSQEEISHYEASITPSNQTKLINISDRFVSFSGLVPGKLYTINIQTVLVNDKSEPLKIQMRTLPPEPVNVRLNQSSVTSTGFQISWDRPNITGEFDHYHIIVNGESRNLNLSNEDKLIVINKDNNNDTNTFTIKDLIPGEKYTIFMATVSGKISSVFVEPPEKTITTIPLSVINISALHTKNSKTFKIFWEVSPLSIQDGYRVDVRESGKYLVTTMITQISKTYMLTTNTNNENITAIVYATSYGVLSPGSTIEVCGNCEIK